MNKTWKRWTQQEDNILKNNYGKHSLKDILHIFPDRSMQSLYQRAKILDLIGFSIVKRHFQRDFFKELTPLTCYWGGILAADGCVTDKKSVLLGFKDEDRYHLEQFSNDVSYDGPFLSVNNNGFKQIRIKINGAREWISDLEKHFSITPRKSLTLLPPKNLTLEQSLYFIIGYIDGDGSLVWAKNHRNRIFILSIAGTQSILEWIRDIISCWEPRTKALTTIRKHGLDNCYEWKLNGSYAKTIAIKLYELNCPRLLKRKWDKVKKLKEEKCQ